MDGYMGEPVIFFMNHDFWFMIQIIDERGFVFVGDFFTDCTMVNHL